MNVGDTVRVLRIDARLFHILEPDEADDLRSMIDGEFEVEDIRGDYCVVSKEFDRGGGRIESHTVSLKIEEVEVVQKVKRDGGD